MTGTLPSSAPPLAADISALPRIADPAPSPSHKPTLTELTHDWTEAVIAVRSRIPKELRTPKIAIVCGSGLQGLQEILQDPVQVSYADIPGFGESTVRGHQSALSFGYLGATRVPVVAQLGRFHAYEGFALDEVVYPIRLMKLLGVQIAIITNAAGGLNPSNPVGTVVVVQDHISLPSMTSMNPLIGRNRESFGPRFPPMSDAYDFELRLAAFKAAKSLGFPRGTLKEGTYAWVAGPTYETKAEQKFLRAAGADVVGMSTVPEVIAARHAGVRVLVLSLVTNLVVSAPIRSAEAVAYDEEAEAEPDTEQVASHQEVLDTSARRADDIRSIVEKLVEIAAV